MMLCPATLGTSSSHSLFPPKPEWSRGCSVIGQSSSLSHLVVIIISRAQPDMCLGWLCASGWCLRRGAGSMSSSFGPTRPLDNRQTC